MRDERSERRQSVLFGSILLVLFLVPVLRPGTVMQCGSVHFSKELKKR